MLPTCGANRNAPAEMNARVSARLIGEESRTDSELSWRERAGVCVACARGWSGVMRGYFVAGLFRMFWIVFVVNSLPYRVRVPSAFNRLAIA
jgi:hypothetical protein